MLDKINDLIYFENIAKINIKNKEEIEFVKKPLTDLRIDLLLLHHYGNPLNYGLNSELFMFLIFMFNDFNDFLNMSVIKLPHINELIEHLTIEIKKDKIPGVYTEIETTDNINDKIKIVNELALRLKRTQQYDKKTGILKY